MTAYAIGQITIKDQGKWAEYCRHLPDTLATWDAAADVDLISYESDQ